MFITTVIPIARGIPFDILSYYVQEQLCAGTLVTIPFGKQTIHGIVTETVTIAEAKGMIKSASFTLKKVKTVIGVIPSIQAAALALADTSALTLTPIGTLASNVIPQTLFDYINSEKIVTEESIEQTVVTTFEETVTLGPTVERVDHYKRLIRTAFAAKKSVVFTAPTIRSLERFKILLEKGITNHVVILHSKTTKKQLRSSFALLKSSERPLVIFATPSFFVLPRTDIGSIIAEDESQSLYHTSDRYKSDLRIFIKSYAERLNLKLIWGDTLPRFATLKKLDADHVARTYIPDKLTVVPIEPYRTVLPTEVIEIIRHAQKKGRRLYVYANRKGVAPLSRCSDCGTIVNCTDCSLPMVLRNKITSEGEHIRSFSCSHCSATLPSTHTCTHCGSWNITPSAIGSESIRDAIVSLVGTENVVTIDDDLTPDSVTIQKLITESDVKKFVVIIGTIKVLPYLKQIHYSLFPFFDRLLSTPSLYTTENVLRLIMECNERSSEGVLVFSRDPEFPFTKQIETQKINAIIHDELTLRAELGYPPFGSIIKVSLTVPEGYRQSTIEKVTEFFGDIDITMMPVRRISQGSMKVLLVWIIPAATTYIEEEGLILSSFLQSLRFPYLIEENPERL
ncbi:hypothetical protein K2Q02_02295 [Patescibacteria group bacterium]|nr:hypothetical protein [Patescibacteria group bacterium]